MREDTRGEWEEGIRRCGALEVLKAWCEVRIGRTPGPKDVAEERRRPRGVQWGHDLSMGRTLEKLGPALYMHPSAWKGGSPKFAGTEFFEVAP
jgi:hypothetical protein